MYNVKCVYTIVYVYFLIRSRVVLRCYSCVAWLQGQSYNRYKMSSIVLSRASEDMLLLQHQVRGRN